MSKSPFVEVNITNSTKLAQDSQNTADTAANGVTNLNDPNLMSVIEKQHNILQFAGLTSQYNVIIQNAKDDGIDTTAITTAYNNLNKFMADILADPSHASAVDRTTYKKYQDAYNEELANIQSALQNNANNKFTSAANATSQAASTASQAFLAADSAFSQAQLIGSQADSEIAVQSQATAKAQSAADNAFSQAQTVFSQADSEIAVNSMATAKAQSTADSAFSQAQKVFSQADSEIAVQSTATAKAQSTADSAFSQAVKAIDTGEVTSQAVTALKDGSTMTIAELENGLATKVANSDYASYKTQTASQIGQMVTNGAFSAYQQTTADLIASKVANSDFSAYQATTAKSIDSKVSSDDFNTYKTQTADLIDDKVSSSEYASDKTQTASEIADKVSNSAFSTYQTQTASQIASKVDNGDFSTYKTQTADLIDQKVATSDFSAYQATTAKEISSKVESSDFNTYKTQAADLISSKVESSNFQALQTQVNNSAVGTNLLAGTSDFTGWTLGGGTAQGTTDGLTYAHLYSNTSAVAPSFTLAESTTYTVSFDALGYSAGTTPIYIGYSEDSSGNIIASDYVNATLNAIDGTSTRVSLTFTTTSSFTKTNFNIGCGYGYGTGGSAFIRHVKLELGSVATDWSLSPEDQATQSQITQLSGEIDQKVDSGDFSTYKTQTASQIASKVDNGDFSTYKTQTADLISSKVATNDFNTYTSQTATAINSKVETSDFNTYKTQTADLIDAKVSSSEYASDKTQNASEIADRVSNSAFSTYQTQTASQIASKVDNGDFSTYKTQTANLIAQKVANSDFSAYQATTAKSIDSKVSSSDFNTYKTQTADAISSKVESSNFQALQTQVNNSTVGTNLFSQSTATSGYIDGSTGNIDLASSSINEVSDYISVSAGSTYTFQMWGTTPSAQQYWYGIGLYDSDKKFISRLAASGSVQTSDTAEHVSKTLTTTSATAYVRVSFRKYNDYKAKIEKGSVATDWCLSPEDQATQSQITQLSGEIEQKVDSGDFSTYKTQTASEIADTVSNSAFSTYQTQAADLIAQKVATSDFSAYQATTAKSIDSKVETSDFNTYKTQTADLINDKVSSATYTSDKTQTDKAISSKVESSDFKTLQTQVNNSAVGTNLLTGTSGTLQTVTNASGYNNNLPAITPVVATIESDTTYTARVWLSPASHDMRVQVVWQDSSSETHYGGGNVISAGASGYSTWTGTITAGSTIQRVTIIFTPSQSTASTVSYKEMKFELGSVATDWSLSPEDQATQSQITQLSDDISLRVKEGDLISQINLKAGKTLISSGGQLTLSGDTIYFDSANPVVIPSANIDTALVNKKLTAADISANTFTTNNDTFIVDSSGAVTAKNMTLNGGTLTSPTINASTINGSAINGTTFHGGDIISNSNNTAGYYPMSITSNGAYNSTYFDSAVGLQSSVESGAISYDYRSMISSGGTYLYDSVGIDGQGITLSSGTTATKDTTFSAAQTETAYISLTTGAGLYLHGSNANIDFGGHLSDDSTSVGMYMNPYGNLIGKSASQYWQISIAGTDNSGGGPVARFGIDKSSAYNIVFNRELDVGNIEINTAHTFTSADNGAFYFKTGKGDANDIYAGDVHYTSLVKSSLLSVKKDVQKADTAYWAQLVNSIDLATYQYKTDDNTSHLRLSSIVDDVNDTKQWQLPDIFISRDEDGKLCGVDDSVLLNATLATVQEQQKEIDQLNGHNMELEARLNKLEAKLNG